MFGGDDSDNSSTMLIIGAIVVVIIIGAVAYWYFYIRSGASSVGPTDATTGLITGSGSNTWKDTSGAPIVSFMTGRPMPVLSGPPIVYAPDAPVDPTYMKPEDRQVAYMSVKGVPQYTPGVVFSPPELTISRDRNYLRTNDLSADPRFEYIGNYNNTVKCHDAIKAKYPDASSQNRFHFTPYFSEFSPKNAEKCFYVADISKVK